MIQKKAGFLYDSTFGFRNDPGFKEDKYQVFTPKGMQDFYVVPMAIMDMNVMNKQDPWKTVMEIIDIAEENNACLNVNWHQRIFNEKEFPNWSKIYVKLIKECKKRGATFLTLGELVDNQKEKIN